MDPTDAYLQHQPSMIPVQESDTEYSLIDPSHITKTALPDKGTIGDQCPAEDCNQQLEMVTRFAI